MRIAAPTMAEVDDVADLWVSLAADQRAHRSHLLAAENRGTIREAIARRVVSGGLLVVRAGDATSANLEADGENDGDAADRAGGDGGDDDAEADGDEDPDRLVGFVMFGPETGDFEQEVVRGVVENIYVDPAFRGRGVGGELLAAAEERLFEDGADRVSLEVLADNEDARRFYARHGYAPHRVELEKDGENDTHKPDE